MGDLRRFPVRRDLPEEASLKSAKCSYAAWLALPKVTSLALRTHSEQGAETDAPAPTSMYRQTRKDPT
jgi:hypothetical protein